jgi:transcriptional/translational regulatory protein YebC/TACO1
MQVVYRLDSSELNIDFLDSVKTLFKNKTVEIIVADEDDEDKAMTLAIDKGLKSETVGEEELLRVLRAD